MGLQQQPANGVRAVSKTNIIKMNLKTTTLGILTIVAAVSGAGKSFLTTGQIPDLTAVIAAIMAGIGLITAKDAAAK